MSGLRKSSPGLVPNRNARSSSRYYFSFRAVRFILHGFPTRYLLKLEPSLRPLVAMRRNSHDGCPGCDLLVGSVCQHVPSNAVRRNAGPLALLQ